MAWIFYKVVVSITFKFIRFDSYHQERIRYLRKLRRSLCIQVFGGIHKKSRLTEYFNWSWRIFSNFVSWLNVSGSWHWADWIILSWLKFWGSYIIFSVTILTESSVSHFHTATLYKSDKETSHKRTQLLPRFDLFEPRVWAYLFDKNTYLRLISVLLWTM